MSTMKGFRRLNLNRLLNDYRDQVADEWELGDYLGAAPGLEAAHERGPPPRARVGRRSGTRPG